MRFAVVLLLAGFAFAQEQPSDNPVEVEHQVNADIRKQVADAEAAKSKAVEKTREARAKLREASREHDDWLKQYDVPASNPSGDKVRKEITALRRMRPLVAAQREEVDGQIADIEALLYGVAEDEQDWKGKLDTVIATARNASSKTDDQWNTIDQREFDKIGIERARLYQQLRAALRDESVALHDEGRELDKWADQLGATLWLHQRMNLFLKSPPALTWPASRDAFKDLALLGDGAKTIASATGRYLDNPDHRAGVVRWAVSSLAVILLVIFLGRGLRRRTARMDALMAMDVVKGEDGDDVEPRAQVARSIYVLLRFLRRALHLGIIFLIPWTAASLLPGLPEAAQGFFREMARFLSLTYGVWAIYRELLRPSTPEYAVMRCDDITRRRIRLAMSILIGSALLSRPVAITLQAIGYPNQVAYLLLDLILLAGLTLALSGIAFRKRVFVAILPRGDAGWPRLARTLGLLVRPFLQLVVIAILVLHVLRYKTMADAVTSFSLALVAVIIVGTLSYQLLKSILLHRIDKSFGDESDSAEARAARGASIFALRVVVLLAALWALPFLAGTTEADFHESLQIPLPFQTGETAPTLWDLGAAIAMGLFFWFGTAHAKGLLQYQVLARVNIDRATQYTIATLFGYVVLTFGMVMALRMVVNLSALGTIVAALSVGIGFGMQDIVSNFISGIVLLFERPIRVGDTIEVGENHGLVRQINIRATTVQTRDNIFILVPNRNLISQEVVNYGYDDPKMRLRIPVGVSYGSKPREIEEVLLKVAADHQSVLRHPMPLVHFIEFADSSLNFNLLVWIQRAEQRMRIISDINFAIFAAFAEANIEIPFPQRDIHIRSQPESESEPETEQPE